MNEQTASPQPPNGEFAEFYQETRQPSFPNITQTITLLLLFLVINFALAIPITIIGKATNTNIQDSFVAEILITLCAYLFVIWLGLKKNQAQFLQFFSFNAFNGRLLIPIAFMILGLALLLSEIDNLVRTFAPPPEAIDDFMHELVSGKNNPIRTFLLVIVMAPLLEEILFRGLFLKSYLNRYSTQKALITSALFFSIFHMNPWQMPSAFVGGLVLGWWFMATGSLWPCIFAHALMNSLPALFLQTNIEIQGFTNVEGPTQFQPWWLDLTGILLVVVGVFLWKYFDSRTLSNTKQGH